MKEQTLLKIALTCTIFGIIILLILSEVFETDFYSINEIKNMDKGEVRTDGTIQKILNKGNLTIITISRTEYIDIIIFENVNFTKGQHIEVTGNVEEYIGKKEIIANSLKTK